MAPATVNLDFVNSTNTSPVFAYVTGQVLGNNQLGLLRSDGKTIYHPASPSASQTSLAADCAIPLGPPGSTRTATIPQMAGGRIWFSVGSKLNFLLNPGPALVEPSVTNPSDPSIDVMWDFAEFTFNSAQLFANITYVDFFSIPIALTLTNRAGGKQHVAGTDQNGLSSIAEGIRAQQTHDNIRWESLIVNDRSGRPLRILSPNNGLVANASLFDGYWEPYIDQVWARYTNTDLAINTQASFGNVIGRVSGDVLKFPNGSTFSRPSARDIFTCSTGPFAGNSPEALAIIPRLSAAFNRSVLLFDGNHPDDETPSQYYTVNPTNHYSRIVHSVNLDKRGYAFPYDDVAPSNGADQAGTVFDGDPVTLTLAIGGNNATV